MTCATSDEPFGIDPWRALIFLLTQGRAFELARYRSDVLACVLTPVHFAAVISGRIDAGLHLDDRARQHARPPGLTRS